MVTEATQRRVQGYADYVRTFALQTYGLDIRAIPFDIVPVIQALLGNQPGLYLDSKAGSKMMGKKVFGDGFDNSKRVLIAEINEESGVNYYWGIVFHEYGHATFDAGKANGEPGAWTVELMALAKYVTEADTSLAATAKAYTKARRAGGCFGQFGKVSGVDYTAASKQAYLTLTGEEL